MALNENLPEPRPVGYAHLPGPDLLDAEGRARMLYELAEIQGPPDSLSDLLDDVTSLLVRYVAFPSDAALVAVALWVAHTHTIECFDTTPRLAVLSAEKESGKTRLLEVLNHVCANPVFTPNLTTASLFRLIDARQPTVLLDEADAIFNPRANNHEELRGLLNAGYRRGATVPRVVGEGSKMNVKEFAAFTPVALAGIGKLPDTIISRAILIRMRRRSPVELVEPFREREARRELQPLRERFEGWSIEAAEHLQAARPPMPQGVEDRSADIWEPLLAIADLAGGSWSTEARSAAVEITAAVGKVEPSLGERLLADIRTAYESADVERLGSQELCNLLHKDETAPWGDLYGKPLDPRGLAKRLYRYGIKPHQIRISEDHRPQGYVLEDFRDAWFRYLPSPSPQTLTSPDEVGQTTLLDTPSEDVRGSQGSETEGEA